MCVRQCVPLLIASALHGEQFTLQRAGTEFTVSTSAFPATVVVFISTLCPVSNAYLGRMNELYSRYSASGVQFAFVNSNANESHTQIDSHARANRLAFPVFTDRGNAVANRLGAEMTPQVFVLDRQGSVRYRGRIDDAVNPARVRSRDLQLALDALLAGQSPPVAEGRALGCSIKRARAQ